MVMNLIGGIQGVAILSLMRSQGLERLGWSFIVIQARLKPPRFYT